MPAGFSFGSPMTSYCMVGWKLGLKKEKKKTWTQHGGLEVGLKKKGLECDMYWALKVSL